MDKNHIDNAKKCPRCGYEAKTDQHYYRHLNRKKPCGVLPNVAEGVENKCMYCNGVFANKYILKKHEGRCPIKNGGINKITDPVTKVNEELRIIKEEQKRKDEELAREREETRKKFEESLRREEELKAELAALRAIVMGRQTTPVVNNNTINIVGDNNRINFYLEPNSQFLKEGTNKTVLLKAIDKYGVGLPFQLVEAIWFNKNRPENHSIRHVKGNICEVQGEFGLETKDLTEVAKDVRDVVHDISVDLIRSVSDNSEHREFANNIRNNKCFHDVTTEREVENVRGKIVTGSKNIGWENK